LIVDDVLTTGKSMEEMRKKHSNVLTIGVVLFARGKCPKWVEPIFNMWDEKV
jgi:orotate phosphoribosyltransferase